MAVLCEKMSKGQIESMVSEGIIRFHMDSFGRGPQDTRTHVLGSLVVVFVRGSLTLAERKLAENGDGHLVKEIRRNLFYRARSELEGVIKGSLGARPVSMHYDLSAENDEEMIAFSLK